MLINHIANASYQLKISVSELGVLSACYIISLHLKENVEHIHLYIQNRTLVALYPLL